MINQVFKQSTVDTKSQKRSLKNPTKIIIKKIKKLPVAFIKITKN